MLNRLVNAVDDLCSQEFSIIDDFLSEKDYKALQTIAQQLYQQGLFRNAKIGLQQRAQQQTHIRSDQIYWLEDTLAHVAVQHYRQQLHNFMSVLNQQLFLSLSEFESHFALYPPNTWYKKHVDQFITAKNRKISCVYYLNNQWHSNWGGELQLYSREDELIEKILPYGNRFVCFNSELPHEVYTTSQIRMSITGWMKTSTLFTHVINV